MIFDPFNNWVVDGASFELAANYVAEWLADAEASGQHDEDAVEQMATVSGRP